MAMVNGVVEWAGENKFGGHSIRVAGNYYNSKFPIKCDAGDTVEFDAGTTGKYCNKLRVVSAGSGASTPAPSSAPSFAGGRRGNFPIPRDDGQRSIIRQNAMARAAEIVALQPEKLKTREDILVEMLKIATEIERFTAGDLDREAVADAKAKLSA